MPSPDRAGVPRTLPYMETRQSRGADVLMVRYFDGVILHCLSTNTNMGLVLVRYMRDRGTEGAMQCN